MLDIVLTSHKEYVDNVNIFESLGCSGHNQVHFIIINETGIEKYTTEQISTKENIRT